MYLFQQQMYIKNNEECKIGTKIISGSTQREELSNGL